MTTKIYDATGDITSPIVDFFSITKHDSNLLAKVTRAIWVGTAGDLAITTEAGTDITLKNVPVGLWPIRAQKVRTATTAADLLGGV